MDNNIKNLQYAKFCAYGFFKNLRFFEIFFILFLLENGLSYLNIGLLYSIRQITINLMEIPSGIIADAFSRKRALLFALSAYLISFIIFYFSHRFFFLAMAMVLYGLGEAFRSGTHKAIILQYLKDNNLLSLKTRYYGSTRSWSQMGSALVALLAALFFYLGADYRLLFLITVIPYLIDLLIISSYPSDNKSRHHHPDVSLLKIFRITFTNFIQLFKSRESLKAMFSSASYIAFFKSIKDYLQPLLQILALQIPILLTQDADTRSALLFGVVFFCLFILTSIISKNAWRIERRLKHLPLAINRLYLIGVGSIGLAGFFIQLNLNMLAVFVFVFLYLVQNARRPLMVSYLSDKIDAKVLASGLSAASQLETILIALFAPALGLLIDMIGLGGGLAAGSAIFLLLYFTAKL